MSLFAKPLILLTVFLSLSMAPALFALDIDEQIRASEDPNYLNYLKEREKQREINKKWVKYQKKKRKEESIKKEKNRIKQVQLRKIQQKEEERAEALRLTHEKQVQKDELKNLKLEKKYYDERRVERIKKQKTKEKNLNAFYKKIQNRMPASFSDRPRVPANKRKY